MSGKTQAIRAECVAARLSLEAEIKFASTPVVRDRPDAERGILGT